MFGSTVLARLVYHHPDARCGHAPPPPSRRSGVHGLESLQHGQTFRSFTRGRYSAARQSRTIAQAPHTVARLQRKRLRGSEHAHVPPRWHAASVCRCAHMATVLSSVTMRGSTGMPDTDNLQGNAHQHFQAFLWLPPSDGRACPALSFGLSNGKNHHYLSSFLFSPRHFSDSPDAAKPTPGGCGVACLSKGEIRPFFPREYTPNLNIL